MRKIFVLDTNVILHNPDSLTSFADNVVLLPMEVLEELDKFKRYHDERGRNARIAIRMLDEFRKEGEPGKEFPINDGGSLRISSHIESSENLFKTFGLSPNVTDNRILLSAYNLKSKGEHVIFVSKDISARIKADALGIKCMDFEKQKVDFDKLYSGWAQKDVSGDIIDKFHRNKGIEWEKEDSYANQFFILSSPAQSKHTLLARYDAENSKLVPLAHDKTRVMAISPKNKEQMMALELLLNDDIKLVTLLGAAGTGKTLLALATGLYKVTKENKYSRLLISRPIVPIGRDIGYLPGTKEEKLEHWMGPIFDNLEYICSMDKSGKNTKKVKGKALVEKYVKEDVIVLEAMTFMRGRSIAEQFIIIDEAQNLTPHEIKTVISRAGEGSKLVLTGDPYQIDNPYLDSSSNGLSYCVEKMKDQKMFGHVTLTKSERSELASLAADIL
ncbi:PhoH family protein [Candidatus Omnitrophus magneticus]|uniref:PhoH family protein n=1 Tax=Candidatus Omnitrophus magneticus TaxID=1609969 RepID=A0A0F0CRN1_9BACT|nr:PhoH family protein [Candidatus Omnitrophus magneticus]